MPQATRIVLADDHPLIRSGINTVFAATPDMLLIGEATNGAEAQRLCRELQPHVLLLDLNMPGPSAAETVMYVRANCPDVKILVLSAHDDDVSIRSMVVIGVVGYVIKNDSAETLLRAIRTVMTGDRWFSWSILEKLVQTSHDQPIPDNEVSLTNREQQLLSMIARGWDNPRIGAELNLAEQTVRNYISRIYLTIGVASRAEAVVWARERGFADMTTASAS
jgi:two-component system response regulator DegU